MSSRSFTVTVLALMALIVYLFVSAPPPLPENTHAGAKIPIAQAFAIAEAENDVMRALWTKEIVGAGKKAGLKFDEDWQEEGVEAGPLPALFLRETARSLEKNPVRLGLYLGSDFPINDANQFAGIQREKFKIIKATREPQFFYSPDTESNTAMFPDVAVAEVCIKCHNEHDQSPKSDWKLDDVMGATTWTYPAETVTLDELIKILNALRQGFRDAYSAYLAKAQTFAKVPVIGDKWLQDGHYLPTVDVFMGEAIKRASPQTLEAITALVNPSSKTEFASFRDSGSTLNETRKSLTPRQKSAITSSLRLGQQRH